MSVYISSIGSANPENRYSQQQLVDFMTRVHDLDDGEKRKLVALYRASGIRYRYSVLKDFQMNGHYDLFKIKEENAPQAGTSNRMEKYQREALSLSCRAIDNCTSNLKNEGVTHIITVSCTGFYAPGLDYEIIRNYNLDSSIERYGINFMGCYAAINGLKAGWNICRADENAKVLIVCVELCSIHLQKEKTDDNLLANALFGDGAAAVLLSGKKEPHNRLAIKNFFSGLLPSGEGDMAWHITDFGFQMKLSQYVPDVIKEGIGSFSKELFSKISRSQIKHFLVHPGGVKILKVIEQHFQLTKEENKHAYDVLKNYGNMSSPTILFVIKRFLESLNGSGGGDNVLALAFGPGLTLESALLEVVDN